MHSLSDSGLDLFRADLHCHSTYSDGTFSPMELIDHAMEIGLSALSITDHDTIDAYQEGLAYAKEKNFLLGTGIEFSCQYKHMSVHILGYDLSLSNSSLHDYCLQQQKGRRERNSAIIEKLQKLRFPVTYEELELQNTKTTIGRPHIGNLLLKKGIVSSLQEAFSLYLGDGKCCYVPGPIFSVPNALEVIHQADGKAFIAHPHLYADESLIREILKYPFDGIECHYAKSSLAKRNKWIQFARKKNLLMSGGSDFHGTTKPHLALGCSWVDKETFFRIFEKNI